MSTPTHPEHCPPRSTESTMSTTSTTVVAPFRMAFILLDDLQRWEHPLRPEDVTHVSRLEEHLISYGLLHPLVVDARHRVIAGNHRWKALTHLRESKPDIFQAQFPDGRIPAMVLPFDADEDIELTFGLMASENLCRKDPSPEEIVVAREYLRAQGYHVDAGRPPEGQKPIRTILAQILGCTERQVKRGLQVARAKARAAERALPVPPRANVTDEEEEEVEPIDQDVLDSDVRAHEVDSNTRSLPSDEATVPSRPSHIRETEDLTTKADEDRPPTRESASACEASVEQFASATSRVMVAVAQPLSLSTIIATVAGLTQNELIEFDAWYMEFRKVRVQDEEEASDPLK